ncbi:MAG TPA: hypothetical protein PLL24_06090 [Thiobacillaceae bacterium]|nr:hypothetical protein [Thiobacillaceae bacterium]
MAVGQTNPVTHEQGCTTLEGISSKACLDPLAWSIGLSFATAQTETGMDASLEAAVARAMASSPRRVVFPEWRGKKYVVKRIVSKSKGKGHFKLRFLASLSRWAFPGHVYEVSLQPGDGHWELERNQALAAAGERVPRVVLTLPDAVVYEHCGTVLSRYLEPLSRHQRQVLIRQAMIDLARFHHAGHWHGSAQFRNVVVLASDESGMPGFCRIDFEENLADQFSLPLLQMYDMGLFLAEALVQDVEMTDVMAWGRSLLGDYRAVHWPKDYAFLLGRLARMARPILWLAPLLQRYGNWDSDRALALARVFAAVARDEAAKSAETTT